MYSALQNLRASSSQPVENASASDFGVHVDSLWLRQLFTKRYYKTKHGTYVPTLREYWKPGATRKDLMAIRSKRR